MTLEQMLVGLIAVGCSPLIKWLMDKLAEEFEPSPKTLRRLTYLVSVVAPTVVYGLVAIIRAEYDWTAHLVAVIAAFTGSQVIHGERDLKSGAEIRLERTFGKDTEV